MSGACFRIVSSTSTAFLKSKQTWESFEINAPDGPQVFMISPFKVAIENDMIRSTAIFPEPFFLNWVSVFEESDAKSSYTTRLRSQFGNGSLVSGLPSLQSGYKYTTQMGRAWGAIHQVFNSFHRVFGRQTVTKRRGITYVMPCAISWGIQVIV